MACPVCDGTGKLLSKVCPLCDDFNELRTIEDEGNRSNASSAHFNSDSRSAPMLAERIRKVINMLSEGTPYSVEGVIKGSHELPPYIPKAVWEDLGSLVRAQERLNVTDVPGHNWISLRLDGCGFSKQTRRLRREGVLDEGYSSAFGDIMRECVKELMEKFHGYLGYTQSDEMTVLIRPANVVRGEQQCHLYGGRVQKLCSISASTVTAMFNRRVFQVAEKHGIILNESFPLSHFDCRVGAFESQKEAIALVLWRAQDCGVNGVSDAVHQIKGAEKSTKNSNTGAKLAWLAEQGRLPLPAHQAYGSLFVNEPCTIQGVDPRTGECTTAVRRRISQINTGESQGSRCVLNLMKEGKLFPT
eukprot:gnl/MRDRNA2_/MRDRNA2_29676_c0_seq1.p1 gnl/MRDRNA2_/MRDRNA2_29676_c0~~gnl/MRDRNA2_/MRDRNA2_29676_c0_seq1.p1  ORF type:complete len:359 (+),score=54.44 gnl/MRDRNA2_/MRDRNA2_29676_c0_seq1:54-1130(+)